VSKITRSEFLRELVEDAEGYDGREEWREAKKQRRLKSLRESKSPKNKDTQRRAWKIQRAIRHGDFDVIGGNKTQTTNEEKDNE
jgi:hypothetical protein